MYQGLGFAISSVMVAARASGLFVSLATFQSLSQVVVNGLPEDQYADVAGLVAIPCMDAPLEPGTISALEAKALEEIESKGLRHVLLNDYYPAVIAGWPSGWRCIVDGIVYDLISAEQDSQATQTRCKLQLVTVAS